VRHPRRESRLRGLVLGLLFAVGTALAVLLARERPVTPLRSSLATPFQLLGRRTGSESMGTLADLTRGLLVRHSFSKAEEHEADAYAFTVLTGSRYDPAALGSAFASLQRAQDGAHPGGPGGGADPLRDYVSSHPPLPLRREAFRQEAAAWWRRHPHERRYLGVANLRRRETMDSKALPGEWRQGAEG